MEEHMKTTADLADWYEARAIKDELIAEGIIKALRHCPPDVRSLQLCRADMLMTEAVRYRSHVAELRTERGTN